jgi:hypothetical protein
MRNSHTIVDLGQAIVSAAGAFLHADWQVQEAERKDAKRKADKADDPIRGIATAQELSIVAQVARSSRSVNAVTFEALLSTWLAHAVAFPTMRLDAVDAQEYTQHADVLDARDMLPFAASILDRIAELHGQ